MKNFQRVSRIANEIDWVKAFQTEQWQFVNKNLIEALRSLSLVKEEVDKQAKGAKSLIPQSSERE